MKRHELKDHVAGAIYGFAVGDSVGATTEFMSKEQIHDQYGEVTKQLGGGWLDVKPGEVTDDTQMMMCVMEALMKYPDDVAMFQEECMEQFVKWLDTNPKDVGSTCRAGIEYYRLTGSFISKDEDLQGNGSLMRYLPCAILGLEEFNTAQGELTHNSEVCASLIQMTSEALYESLKGEYPSRNIECLLAPSGRVQNTFNNAMFHASKGDFDHTLREAVNNGGDADTIAAIACSLAGARVGLSGINPKLIGPLSIEVKKFFGKFIDFSLDFLFTNRID